MEQYENMKQQRIGLQRKIVEMFKNCNQMIQDENAMYQRVQECANKKQEIDEQIEALKRSINTKV